MGRRAGCGCGGVSVVGCVGGASGPCCQGEGPADDVLHVVSPDRERHGDTQQGCGSWFGIPRPGIACLVPWHGE